MKLMGIIDRIAKKCVKSASNAVSDGVKAKAKDVLAAAIPTLIGVGTVILGMVIFKAPAQGGGGGRMPHISSMTITTNNYFFDDSGKTELLMKALSGKS